MNKKLFGVISTVLLLTAMVVPVSADCEGADEQDSTAVVTLEWSGGDEFVATDEINTVDNFPEEGGIIEELGLYVYPGGCICSFVMEETPVSPR